MIAVSLALTAVLLIPPFWFLLPRAGIPASVSLIAIIPLGAIILLWVMAFKQWPSDDMSGRA